MQEVLTVVNPKRSDGSLQLTWVEAMMLLGAIPSLKPILNAAAMSCAVVLLSEVEKQRRLM
jgi:hypothetical protein